MLPAWEKFIELSLTLNEQEQEKHDNIKYFVNEYFCKNYIGLPLADGGRKRARFPIELWNVHESTLNGMDSSALFFLILSSFCFYHTLSTTLYMYALTRPITVRHCPNA